MNAFRIALPLCSILLASPALAQSDDDRPAFTGVTITAIGGFDAREIASADSGALYGGALGYDMAAGSARIGAEVEATGATGRECGVSVANPSSRICVSNGRDLYAGARAGVVTGPVLLYGKLGYTNARVQITTSGGANTPARSSNLDGVRAGVGVEYGAGRFLARAEYRYSNYEGNNDGHQEVVGIGLRF